jgi:ABC-type antimicrobial peptide transport system permease subunit
MRVGEIGIRMAVGATRTDILRLIISDSLFLVAIGTAAGVPVALGITRLISGMLFGLNPQSGIFPLISSGILFVAALVAGYVPAWKASKTDPIQCLRYG